VTRLMMSNERHILPKLVLLYKVVKISEYRSAPLRVDYKKCCTVLTKEGKAADLTKYIN